MKNKSLHDGSKQIIQNTERHKDWPEHQFNKIK